MAQQEIVTVENIKNPSVKRQMTVQSARLNSRKWRVVSGQSAAPEVKKKGVSPADVKPEPANPLVNLADDQIGEFANITSEKETLQAEYETLSGQKPDGRWNEKKLAEKIAALKPTK